MPSDHGAWPEPKPVSPVRFLEDTHQRVPAASPLPLPRASSLRAPAKPGLRGKERGVGSAEVKGRKSP